MSLLDHLNEQQQEAVKTTEGPLLILAGAGSGKTRVLTNRTAYLIDEEGVNPFNILAITFTNKAAQEMRQRIDDMVGFGSESIWVSTFHSTCVRILRRYIDRLGYSSSFTIYDSEDQKTVVKDICKTLQIDTKLHKEKFFLNEISSAKDELIDPITYENNSVGDYTKRLVAQVYKEYQRNLKANNALDFDDLLMMTVELFKLNSDVLSSYQERFRYIMVDEYQDTNTAQFEFIRLLAQKYKNLCVVGDDDQSIYKFRGANIYNILNFEKYFPEAKVIKLEQNYRSTQNILDAANAVIANNIGRKAKSLWTQNDAGEKIVFRQADTGNEEASLVAADIQRKVKKGCHYKDCAVLYRTNAQSRLFEERFIANNIPYHLIGGTNFYSRKEVKDVLAYLKTIDNGHDDLAVKRIINIPKRGIGAATINKVAAYAMESEMDFFQGLRMAEDIPGLGAKTAAKLRPFVLFIQSMRAKVAILSVSQLLEELLEETGYVKELEAEETDEARSRIENINELITKAVTYEEGEEHPTLNGFLEQVALVADIDSLDENSDYVVLMTLHSAKGLEFDNVYLTGMEDGLFPSYMSITSDDSANEVEEERRLAYVGITRARQHLMITAATTRMIRGQTQFNKVSRFVKEIPKALLSGEVYEPKARSEWDYGDDYGFMSRMSGSYGNVHEKSYGNAHEKSYGNSFDSSYGSGRTFGKTGNGSFGKNSADYSGKTGFGSYGKKDVHNRSLTAEDDIFNLPEKKKKEPVYTEVKNQKSFAGINTGSSSLGYQTGDRVRHIKFGEGTVKAIIAGGRDFEVTVDFDRAGTKKMFASFAKLKKIQ